MAIARRKSNLNVVEAAKIRLKNIFSNKVPVYFSFSGGKDSLVLAHLIYSLIQKGEIDPKLLTVHFIDEEAIFPCVERIVKDWRRRFMMVGAKFVWFCLEVKHYSCLNELENDESFICWDRYKKDVWVRPMPPFAVSSHPLLRPRKDTYQDFLPRIETDGITIVGVRTAESFQRLSYFSQNGGKMTTNRKMFPIYDWKNDDVWLYLYENNIEIPDAYLYMWQTGAKKSELRISQFFSIDTVRHLVNLNEYYPDLMKRITRREPNAYLVALYWDSEMFRRNSKRRRENEEKLAERNDQQPKEEESYRKKLAKLLADIDGNFDTEHKRWIAKRYRAQLLKYHNLQFDESRYKELYEALVAGDPKRRSLRAIMHNVISDHISFAKGEKVMKDER